MRQTKIEKLVFSRLVTRGLSIGVLGVGLVLVACGGSSPSKNPNLPGTLLDAKTLKLDGSSQSATVQLGTGEQTATVTFPAGVTKDPIELKLALSSNVERDGATPASGTVVQFINNVNTTTNITNITFSMPAHLQLALAPPASAEKIYRAAHAAGDDKAWTIGSVARSIGPATVAGAATGKIIYEIDVLSTGIWTIVLADNAGGTGGAGGGAGAGGLGVGGRGGAGGMAAGGLGGGAPLAGSGGAAGGSVAGANGGAGGSTGGALGGVGGAATGGLGGSGGAGGVSATGGGSAGAAGGSGTGGAAGGSPGTGGTVVGVGAFKQVALAPDGHTCALRMDGTIACWGENGYKQSSSVPTGTFTQVAVAIGASCGLRADGSTACWTSNSSGITTVPTDAFSAIASLGGLGNNSNPPENSTACGVKADGTVKCWGNPGLSFSADAVTSLSAGSRGACGIKETDGSIVCSLVRNLTGAYLTPPAGTFSQLSVGTQHACAVKTDGTVACWGTDTGGDTTPPSGKGFTEVAAGDGHSCALRNGNVLCWGDNSYGQATPPRGTFVHLSAGVRSTCGILADTNGLVCWGDSIIMPQPLDTIGSAYDHTCAIGADKTVACWGANDAQYKQSVVPSGTFANISPGPQRNCGVRLDGSTICWGRDGDVSSGGPTGPFAQLIEAYQGTGQGVATIGLKSDGTAVSWGVGASKFTSPSATFKSVITVGSDLNVACAVKTDGTLACWGLTSPLLTTPTGTFTQMSIGQTHACAVGTDGYAKCWGTTTAGNTTAPNGQVLQVAAGTSHSCAIWTDGTLTCWGANTNGQSAPPTDGTYTQIVAGGNHTCALDSNKQMWCWGDYVMFPL